ncbi:hypothetical protein BM1_08648 [Bipolaris maydis]|nr:hypothetical protein BM1_08648 [Bipolaris maydis]
MQNIGASPVSTASWLDQQQRPGSPSLARSWPGAGLAASSTCHKPVYRHRPHRLPFAVPALLACGRHVNRRLNYHDVAFHEPMFAVAAAPNTLQLMAGCGLAQAEKRQRLLGKKSGGP